MLINIDNIFFAFPIVSNLVESHRYVQYSKQYLYPKGFEHVTGTYFRFFNPNLEKLQEFLHMS